MINIGRLSVTGIEGVQALLHLSGIIAFKDINRYTQCFGIPYLLWLAAVVTSRSEEKVSLLKVNGDFHLFSPFPGSLFQARPVSAEEVES